MYKNSEPPSHYFLSWLNFYFSYLFSGMYWVEVGCLANLVFHHAVPHVGSKWVTYIWSISLLHTLGYRCQKDTQCIYLACRTIKIIEGKELIFFKALRKPLSLILLRSQTTLKTYILLWLFYDPYRIASFRW